MKASTENRYEAHTLTSNACLASNRWSRLGSSNQWGWFENPYTRRLGKTPEDAAYLTQRILPILSARRKCQQPVRCDSLRSCHYRLQPVWTPIVSRFNSIIPYFLTLRHLTSAADRVANRPPGDRRSVATILCVPRHRSNHPSPGRDRRAVQTRPFQHPNSRDMDFSPRERRHLHAGTASVPVRSPAASNFAASSRRIFKEGGSKWSDRTSARPPHGQPAKAILEEYHGKQTNKGRRGTYHRHGPGSQAKDDRRQQGRFVAHHQRQDTEGV